MFARMLHAMPSASAQGIANLLSACVKLRKHPEEELVQAAVSRMLALMQDCKTILQHLSKLVWACARLGVHPAGGFTPAYLALLQDMMHFGNPRDLTNALWAYAALKEHLPATFLEAASQRLQTLLPDLHVQGMCQVAFAYGHYKHKPSNGLLDNMALQFQQMQPPPQGL